MQASKKAQDQRKRKPLAAEQRAAEPAEQETTEQGTAAAPRWPRPERSVGVLSRRLGPSTRRSELYGRTG